MSTATLTDNAATVANLYDAFRRGDISLILDHIADDCEWIGAGEGSLPQGGTYIGKDAVNFFRKLGEAEEFNEFNPVSIHNIGDDEVVAFGDMTATSRETGTRLTCDWVMHWKFNEDGKAIYFHDFFDTAAGYAANQKKEVVSASEKQQNVMLVKNAFENFLKGNIQGIVDVCADDIEWGAHENPEVPYAQTFHGKKGVSQFFSSLLGNVDYSAFEPKEFYTDGNKVFVKGYHAAKVKSTGKSFGHPMFLEFIVNNGKISSFFAWVDTRDQADAFKS